MASKVIDGIDTAPFSREQLEDFAYKIQDANDKEREERNNFQTERDKFRTYWEITKDQLEITKAALQNRDRQIEQANERNAEELRLYREKVKHLQYEQQNSLNDAQAETLENYKKIQDQCATQEKELLHDKRKLRGLLKEQELSGLDQMKAMKIQSSEEIGKARIVFEATAKDMETRYKKKFSDLIQHLTSKYEMDLSEVEKRKNAHISDLIKHHEKSFNDMRNYYNDITLNNLTLISTLKEEMEKLRKINIKMAKRVSDLSAELKRLKIPLSKADETIIDLKSQLIDYERDKMTLAETKTVFQKADKECKDLRWAYDALELRFETLQKERDELHNRFVNAVLEVQQKTSVKNLLLHRRIQTLSQLAEHREIVIAELQNASTEPRVRSNQKLEEILAKKNATISDLQYELARVCKLHDDLLETFEDKLDQFGIPRVELGFIPLRIVPEGRSSTAPPAGLLSKNHQ